MQRARTGQLPAAYLLGFKGERGRNPARVFAQLATELEMPRHRDPRDPVVHLFTHAALHMPREIVQAVRGQAHIFGVFILPSGGKLDLDYLDLLEGHGVVDHATLAHGAARADAAKSILDQGQGLRKGINELEAAPTSVRPPPSIAGSRTGSGPSAPPASTRPKPAGGSA